MNENPNWDLTSLKRLIVKLSETSELVVIEDAVELIDKLQSQAPEDQDDREYYESLIS